MDKQRLIDQLQAGIPAILILDDDLNISSGLKDILEEYGYAVDIANYGAEALALLDRKTFSTLITDYCLPDDNGVNISRQAKEKNPFLGLIMMTGHDRKQIKEKMDENEVLFLRKPIPVPVLLESLERTLQRQCEALGITRGNTPPLAAPADLATPPQTAAPDIQEPINLPS